jgi:hypothetical protein
MRSPAPAAASDRHDGGLFERAHDRAADSGTLGGMTKPGSDSSADLTALFDAVGITVTEEGKQRARARRREAEAHWTPERRDALRAQLGLPKRAA